MYRIILFIKKINKEKWVKYFGIVLACACVLSYTAFHISSLFSEEISTIVVGPVRESKTIGLSGYIFRDSEYVFSNNSGVVDYLVADGEKLSAKTQVANVYESGSEERRDLVAMIDRQIEILEKSTEGNYNESDISELRKKASNSYYEIMKQISSGDISSLYSDSENLLIAMNSLSIVKDEGFAIEEKLKMLREERDGIFASSGACETVFAENSSYFYTDTDGYEKIFTEEYVNTLDGDKLYKLMNNAKPAKIEGNCIGKTSGTAKWYYAVALRQQAAEQFEEGSSYRLFFTSGGTHNIEMTLERVLPCDDSDSTVLVFGTSVIPKGFSFERELSAKVEMESVSGIYVPMSAVHKRGGRQIVYVLVGSVVEQRYIDIAFEGVDYYIVRDGVTTDDGDAYLESNELLIVGGTNLFDGRILD